MITRWLQRTWLRLRGYHAPMSTTPITVIHRPEGQTFEAIIDGQRCVADYRRDGSVIRMTHTVVPPALEGRGIAAQLVEAALVWARSEGLKVDPVCSYVRVYIKRHPQWQDLQV
jgi:predicted GNAT family acetyltransferase